MLKLLTQASRFSESILLRFIPLLLVALVGVGGACADTATATPDLSDLVSALKQMYFTTQREIYVYSWSEQPELQGRYDKSSDLDKLGYKLLSAKVPRFWSTRNKESGGTFYGEGLYAANNPISTRSYGGTSWVLSQLRLPTGFRLFNFDADDSVNITVTPTLANSFKILGCPAKWANQLYAAELITGHGDASPQCLNAIFDIFENQLKIDGFIYGYDQGATDLEACDPEFSRSGNQMTVKPGVLFEGSSYFPFHGDAFVITSLKSLPVERTRLFNANSTNADTKDDRLIIQSLFYLEGHDAHFVDNGIVPPAAELRSPYVATISSAAPPKGSSASDPTFFWKDLDGSKTPDLWNWIKKNLLSCSGEIYLKAVGH